MMLGDAFTVFVRIIKLQQISDKIHGPSRHKLQIIVLSLSFKLLGKPASFMLVKYYWNIKPIYSIGDLMG